MAELGCDARLVYTDRDYYFNPTELAADYPDVPSYMISGMHDQLAIFPDETFRATLAAIASEQVTSVRSL